MARFIDASALHATPQLSVESGTGFAEVPTSAMTFLSASENADFASASVFGCEVERS